MSTLKQERSARFATFQRHTAFAPERRRERRRATAFAGFGENQFTQTDRPDPGDATPRVDCSYRAGEPAGLRRNTR